MRAFDVESEDLLSHLEDCLAFIDEGCKSGGVFVHWYVFVYNWKVCGWKIPRKGITICSVLGRATARQPNIRKIRQSSLYS